MAYHPLVLRGISQLLKEKYPSSKIVGQATTVRGLITLLRRHKPDAAIIDVAITWKSEGMNFVEEIRKIHPSIELHLISPHPLDLSIRDHLEKHAEKILRENMSDFIDDNTFAIFPLSEVDRD